MSTTAKIAKIVGRFFKNKINNLFKNKDFESSVASIELDKIKTILIVRPNHRLGNQMLITPLVNEVFTVFPKAKVDLFLKGTNGKKIFENYNINSVISLPENLVMYFFSSILILIQHKTTKYDLVINVENNSTSGLLFTYFSKAQFKFYNSQRDSYDPNYFHGAKNPIINLRKFLIDRGVVIENLSNHRLDIKLTQFEIAVGKKTLENIFQNNEKKTIAIYTHAKTYNNFSDEWWSNFYLEFKKRFSTNYNFIEVLYVENIPKLSYQIKNYCSNDVRKIASIISNCEIFISADCCMMHLASASTTTLGLFKNTSILKYKPYGNKSLGIDANNQSFENIVSLVDSRIALK